MKKYEDYKIIIASGPVIIENGKVLLNRHGKDEASQKYWKFAGGKVEPEDLELNDETLENACRREVKEEMGIDIEIILPLKPMMIKSPDQADTTVVLIHYLVRRLGEIKPSSEIVEYRWFDINDLPENCAPNIRPVIKEYKSLKSAGILL